VLSVGEQQRLSFIRLFALFTLTLNKEQLIRETLVLFDESTGAIDAKTEHEIYTQLTELRVWFVTISHRPSLIHFHTKSLQLTSNKDQRQPIEQEEIQRQISAASIFDDDDANKLVKDEKNESELMDKVHFQVNTSLFT
jgi:ABC-type uncharacterized transport system fused permease/ATPase subunit